MIKVLVLFGKPVDQGEFESYFTGCHRPLLHQVPNLERLVVNRIAGAAIGDSPYCLMIELHFSSQESMQEALNSEAGQSMARDLANFASGGAKILFSEASIEPVS